MLCSHVGTLCLHGGELYLYTKPVKFDTNHTPYNIIWDVPDMCLILSPYTQWTHNAFCLKILNTTTVMVLIAIWYYITVKRLGYFNHLLTISVACLLCESKLEKLLPQWGSSYKKPALATWLHTWQFYHNHAIRHSSRDRCVGTTKQQTSPETLQAFWKEILI